MAKQLSPRPSVMLRQTVLGLLLACALSLSSSVPILENGMPILWASAPAQMSGLPTQNDILTPNPWNYLHRMSLYRLLMTATNPFMSSMGPNAKDSPMWPMPLQLGWMLISGRLADPTGATTCGLKTGDTMCISPQSWFGCVNYFSSALPFLSAAQQGFMGAGVQVQMQVPEGVTDYCTTYTDCAARYPDIMSKWDAFFQALKTQSTLPESERKESLLSVYWVAMMASIHANAECKSRESSYSSKEISFGKSWLNAVEFVALAHFHSTLDRAPIFVSNLPSRILKVDDNAPYIPDLSQEENHRLSIFSWMSNINNMLGGTMMRLWNSAMCSQSTRQKGGEMLEQLLVNPGFATSTFMSKMVDMTTEC